MQINSQPTFKARFIFVNPETKVKPFVEPAKFNSGKTHMCKTKKPSWFLKLFFGIRKKVKLPSYKGEK